MKILVACEESQAVTIELRRLGHEAYSCDIQGQSGGHPEWHIMADVLPLLNGNCEFTTMDGVRHSISGKWDMIIAFPPCTKTSNAGARHLWKGGKLNIPRYYDGLCGKALFLAVWAADCDKVIIENPTPSKIFEYPKPTQAVQPYEYGHPYTKKRFYGKGVSPRCARQMSLLRKKHGAQAGHTQVNIKNSTGECLQLTGQRTAQKHSMALQWPWPNNGLANAILTSQRRIEND